MGRPQRSGFSGRNPGRCLLRSWRPSTYTVKRGDTLHAIALEYGLERRVGLACQRHAKDHAVRLGIQPDFSRGRAGERVHSDAELDELTAREREVLQLVAEGKSNKEAAAALFVSPRS